MYENELKFDDGLEIYNEIINGNEGNTYEIINYESDNYGIRVYDEINQNKLKIEENASQTLEYLEIFK